MTKYPHCYFFQVSLLASIFGVIVGAQSFPSSRAFAEPKDNGSSGGGGVPPAASPVDLPPEAGAAMRNIVFGSSGNPYDPDLVIAQTTPNIAFGSNADAHETFTEIPAVIFAKGKGSSGGPGNRRVQPSQAYLITDHLGRNGTGLVKDTETITVIFTQPNTDSDDPRTPYLEITMGD